MSVMSAVKKRIQGPIWMSSRIQIGNRGAMATTMKTSFRLPAFGSISLFGNATGGLNPEPYAYEGAFSVRHLIQKQMSGDESLASAKSPLLLWGPYLWAEGEKGRKIDDLIYVKDDFAGDGVHPSNSGREKFAKQLLEILAASPLAKGWFSK